MSQADRKPEAPVSSGKHVIRQGDERGLSLSERLSHGLHKMSWHTPLRGLRLRGHVPLKLVAVPKDPVAGDKAAGDAILKGRIVQGRHRVALAGIDFRAVGPAYDHVQSFAWLRDLSAASSRDLGAKIAEEAVRTWLDQCGREVDPASWRPELWGRRILFWTGYAPYILSGRDLVFRSQVLNALARGARYLDRSANKADPGLPRITAWAGLITSALVVQGGPARLGRGETGFARALAEALHEDGGLFSRLPEEQLALVELLGQLRAAYAALRAEPPQWLEQALEKAPAALLAATMGDGALGHWQGGGTAAPRRVAAAIEGTGAAHKPLRLAGGWGYQRMDAKKTVVVVDAAPPPPPRASTHGCASTLAFELSDGPSRLIVNCGGGRHAERAIESVLRATAAHSSLVLADRNSTAVQAAGTLGKGVVEVELIRESEGSTQRLEASHDGYVRRFGLVHRRIFELSGDGLSLSGEDRLEPRGRNRKGKQHFAIRFHLAPLVEITSTADGKGALLRIRGGNVWQFRCRGGSLLSEDSIWIDADGRSHQTQQLVISGETDGDGAAVTWSLRRAG